MISYKLYQLDFLQSEEMQETIVILRLNCFPVSQKLYLRSNLGPEQCTYVSSKQPALDRRTLRMPIFGSFRVSDWPILSIAAL